VDKILEVEKGESPIHGGHQNAMRWSFNVFHPEPGNGRPFASAWGAAVNLTERLAYSSGLICVVET
jgi:hypothetical protein